MTIDEQDRLSGTLNRLHTALVCIGEGYTQGRALDGALFVIGDVEDILEKMLKDAERENEPVVERHILYYTGPKLD